MKTAFFSINLVFAVLGLVLGIATLLSVSGLGAAHGIAALAVGLGALLLGGICLCMCGGCLSHRRQRQA
ncbi:hypothetical protein [Sulfurisoma sediminicola]|uniref:Uncharacterized protein n=1 Tax=Sulfurisoma sediminicola TaxID=1381557 RepID=A0A497X8C2_9PROT|nr:hypothetical protein [Sulfurisoma sediminicola]RLJ62089.1 hypothetical protein DFR35_2732 [Sulfurisoma sediminicola]